MRIALVLALMTVAACNRGDDTPLRRADGSLLSSSSGEVQLADGSRLQFMITSDRYKQWEAARSGLRKNVVTRYGELLQPRSPTERSITRAVSFLETEVTARDAITSAGMSVKDFVLMTVALEQEMRLASAQGSRRTTPVPVPPPVSEPPPSPDTSHFAEQDTARRDPTPTPPRERQDSMPTPPRERRDSMKTPPRDTMTRRDSVPTPPRDTARDTTGGITPPPDSTRA